ncbi:PadR family transcriptional regulator [Nonomuraea sp. NPDC000554]|uniref:PadR family transcriptional regulator n=1 Tax=Nonomuraea sp. NPDC000554 TaxID=3154259 RepID=UPI00332EB2CE
MAKRRRVGNLMALAVLAALVQRPMHPYEMASLLRAHGKGTDMKIKWGSLYSVVHSLAKHGLVEVAESSRQGGRPERTIYRLTEAGRQELADWERELIVTPEQELPRFKAALSVISVLAPDEVVTLLQRRLEVMEARLADQREALAGYLREVPRLFLIEDEYEVAMREAEAAWVRSLLEELTSGTFPGLGLWRDYHETGHVPPEISEIAERGGDTD